MKTKNKVKSLSRISRKTKRKSQIRIKIRETLMTRKFIFPKMTTLKNLMLVKEISNTSSQVNNSKTSKETFQVKVSNKYLRQMLLKSKTIRVNQVTSTRLMRTSNLVKLKNNQIILDSMLRLKILRIEIDKTIERRLIKRILRINKLYSISKMLLVKLVNKTLRIKILTKMLNSIKLRISKILIEMRTKISTKDIRKIRIPILKIMLISRILRLVTRILL